MNTFKKSLLIIALLGIAPNVFPQMYKYQQTATIYFYKRHAVLDFFNYQTVSDTLWLPVTVSALWEGVVVSHGIYEYHDNGLLKKLTAYDGDNEDATSIYCFNNTYIDPLIDISDTVFWDAYIYPGTSEQIPPQRWYYNNYQADSSYWEEYYQTWDGEKWNTQTRTYVHLLDTATVSEFQDHIEVFDGAGHLIEGQKVFLTFDDQGNVVEAMIEYKSPDDAQYKPALKRVYTYDTEGKCNAITRHDYTSSGTWYSYTKYTDLKWFEFHGFDNGNMLFYFKSIGHYPYIHIPKDKNKISYYKQWSRCLGGPWGLEAIEDIEWTTHPFSFQRDYFLNNSKEMCMFWREHLSLNERYFLTSRDVFQYDFINCDPEPVYNLTDYIYKYDDRGRCYEMIVDHTFIMPEEYGDSIIHYNYPTVVDSFTYIVRPPAGTLELPADKHTLLIVPNPSDETVRITAADSIATISFYVSDGRLAYSRDGAVKEMTVNIQGLAAGVYIVQAQLKNGGVQAGKVVVR